jgi:hypothetical protein
MLFRSACTTPLEQTEVDRKNKAALLQVSVTLWRRYVQMLVLQLCKDIFQKTMCYEEDSGTARNYLEHTFMSVHVFHVSSYLFDKTVLFSNEFSFKFLSVKCIDLRIPP